MAENNEKHCLCGRVITDPERPCEVCGAHSKVYLGISLGYGYPYELKEMERAIKTWLIVGLLLILGLISFIVWISGQMPK